MMCQPYIGIFTNGAEQWCKKVGLEAPTFNETEKEYYIALRQGHKLFERPYSEYINLLIEKFNESDNYFYSNRSLCEKVLGYCNVGTDCCNGEFCGNTIIGAMYSPIKLLGKQSVGLWIKNISIVTGRIAAYFKCTDYSPYKYDDNLIVKCQDYHFYKNCP